MNNNKYFSYPNNFGILPKSAYEKLLELLKININLMDRLKSDLGFYAGKILLKPKLESFFEDNKEKNHLSYIYSLKSDKNKLDYNLEYILYFNSNNERNNHLRNIVKGYNILQNGNNYKFQLFYEYFKKKLNF